MSAAEEATMLGNLTAWLADAVTGSNGTLHTVAVATAVLIGLMVAMKRLASLGPKKVLPLEDFIAAPLLKKEVLSHDTRRFTFGLPRDDATLGLPAGQHISLQFYDATAAAGDAKGKAVQRSYTPVTDDRAVGYFQLVIKVYKPNPPKFPDGGKMSQYLDRLKIGDIIKMKGPKGHMQLFGGGKFQVKPLGKPVQQRSCDAIGMVAGGTGITPMLQLLGAIFDHPKTSKLNSKLKVKLIYANQTPDDVLCRTELDELARRFPDRFQVWYTVDRFDSESQKKAWKHDVGFISKEMVEKHLVFPSPTRQQFFFCGPPPMIKFACTPALTSLGYTDKDWVVM